MSNRWEEPPFVKVHEGCGGRVRWIEAIDTIGVGYYGECIACKQDHITVEAILPIRVRGEEPGFGGRFDIHETVRTMDPDERADLEWDDTSDFKTNQRRLRADVTGAAR